MRSSLVVPALEALGVWCLVFAVGWHFCAPLNRFSAKAKP